LSESAFLLGAERVIAIDTVPERMALAKQPGAVLIDWQFWAAAMNTATHTYARCPIR
jgi:threonine dehydrogenase-like Zn-dependent dehydrogenase